MNIIGHRIWITACFVGIAVFTGIILNAFKISESSKKTEIAISTLPVLSIEYVYHPGSERLIEFRDKIESMCFKFYGEDLNCYDRGQLLKRLYDVE